MNNIIFKKWLALSELSVIFFKIRLYLYRKFKGFNSNYKSKGNLRFSDYFFGDKLKAHWRPGQHWGKIHPKFPFQYSDKRCAIVVDGKLNLISKYQPKEITQWGEVYYPTYSRGEIELHQKFLYGVFEIRCIVPKDENIITAFWLYSGDYREIDIFEFFEKGDHNKYKKQLITAHWVGYMTPKNYKLPLSILNEMNTYTLIWTKNKLEFKFNGLTIRKITNKRLLRTFNKPMSLIITKGLVKDPGIINNLKPNPLIIDWVKVYATN